MKKLSIVKKAHDKAGILACNLSGQVEKPEEVRVYRGQMERLCRENGGIGLAANQAGLVMNFFIVMPGAKLLPSKAAELVINPRWVAAPDSQEYEAPPEGCLSLRKGQLYKVRRQTKIEATWTNIQGHLVERTLTGYAAQVFQHEADHLRGLTLEETGARL